MTKGTIHIDIKGEGKVKYLYLSPTERIEYAHRHQGRGYELQRLRKWWIFKHWETVADVAEWSIESQEQLVTVLHTIEQKNIESGLEGCVF